MPFKPKLKVKGPRVRVTKPKVSVALVKCGNCGKPYSNPVNHTCVKRASRSPQAKAAKKRSR